MLRKGGHILCALLCLSACFCASLALARPAFAASNPIRITAQTDAMHFPSSVDFYVTATDASSSITQAAIYLTFGVEGYLEHDTISFTPARKVSLSWQENTSSDNTFVNAGTPVPYYWQFQDSAGNSYTGPQQHFTLIDSRFSWQHLSKGLLQVDWYNRPQSFGQFMLKQANQDITHIQSVLGGKLISPVTLWIYQTSSDFQSSLDTAFSSVSISYRAQAFPGLSEVLIVVADPSDTSVTVDMPYTLTQLVLAQLTAHAIEVPTWLNVGLSVYNESSHAPQLSTTLQAALASHSLLRLDDISDGLPDDPNQAYLASAQSWNLVSYMYKTFGNAKMALLIHTMNTPLLDFNDSLKQALGIDQLHLENQWRLSLHQPPVIGTNQHPASTPTGQSTADMTLPVILVVVFIILIAAAGIFFIKQRRKRERQQVTGRQSQQPGPLLQGQDQFSEQMNAVQSLPPQTTGGQAPYREYSVMPPARQAPQE